ncbi:MAG TPA: amino acid synthesis family protein [Burkholderiaceae bacterium]|nr:amino acid synthesis family protein [Burkholderiaceae bacterium]
MNSQISHQIRKAVATVETQYHDGGAPVGTPLRIAISAVVMHNPFAGRHEGDLVPFMDSLQPLAVQMTQQMMAALGVGPEGIEAFGKGSIVGTDGELEHAAMWHAPGGAGLKKALGAKGFVAAGKLMGTLGARLQIPLVYKNSPWVRSHFNTCELTIHDAPKPNELVFALALATGPRVHARLGGLTAAQAEAGQGPAF